MCWGTAPIRSPRTPSTDGGEDEIRKGFSPEQILAHSDEQVRKMTGMVEDGASLADYQKLVAVRDHGEIGPTLTWAHQSFTGPSDLPMSRDALEHKAFQSVEQTGGVTIDLAGNTPHDGYAFAPFKDTEMVVPQGEFTEEHIDRYINLHADELAQPGNHLGMWTANGNIYLDVSQVGPPSVETLAKAQAAHQLAVYDLGNTNEITLGTINDASLFRRFTSRGSSMPDTGCTDLITRGSRTWRFQRPRGPQQPLFRMRGIVGSTWDNGEHTGRDRSPGKNFLQVSGVRGTRGLKRKRQP